MRTLAVEGGRERREQVVHDRVIVSRVERHVLAPALRKRRRDVERSVAVEWCDFDRDHTFDVQEATPEGAIQHTSPDGRLQVKPDDRDHRRDASAVIEHLAIAGVAKSGKTEQRRMVAERDRELRLAYRLGRRPHYTRDHDRL